MIEYVKSQHLKIGDVVAKTVYDERNRLLVSKGNALSEHAINVIREKGYKGIYIINTGTQREVVPATEPLIDSIAQVRIVGILKNIYDNKDWHTDPNQQAFHRDMTLLETEIKTVIIPSLKEAEEDGRLLLETEDGRNNRNWIYYHLLYTAIVSIAIGIKLKMTDNKLYELGLGAILHDMGKSFLSDELLYKRNVTEREKEVLRTHPDRMFRVLQTLYYPVNVTYAVWQHHEKIDGTGYPNGVSDKINENAKIVALASAYDNMANPNPYVEHPIRPQEVLEYLSASTEYDCEYTRLLMQVVVPYPLGCSVALSNGEKGLVLTNHSTMPLRPIIMLHGKRRDMIDLSRDINYLSVVITNSYDSRVEEW